MIYLDYQATTPLAPEARDAMLRWLDGPDGSGFANPHSPHRMGRMAAAAVEVAREQVAALLPAGGRVIFTGSARPRRSIWPCAGRACTQARHRLFRDRTCGGATTPRAALGHEHMSCLSTRTGIVHRRAALARRHAAWSR